MDAAVYLAVAVIGVIAAALFLVAAAASAVRALAAVAVFRALVWAVAFSVLAVIFLIAVAVLNVDSAAPRPIPATCRCVSAIPGLSHTDTSQLVGVPDWTAGREPR